MSKTPTQAPLGFWRLVSLALVSAMILTLLYVLLGPGFTSENWSDALCMSGVILGTGSSVPFLFDAGRSLTMPGKMSGDANDRQTAWDAERAKREKGMTVTFALALAAVLISLISLLTSLW